MSDPSAPPLAFGEVPPPPRWLSQHGNRRLVGRLVVAATAGVILGIAISNQAATNRRHAAELTKEKYAAEYEAHKRKLEANDSPAAAMILIGVAMVLVVAGLYEFGGNVVAPAIARLDDSLARRDAARRRLVRDDTDV
jgi:hypothetical protein